MNYKKVSILLAVVIVLMIVGYFVFPAKGANQGASVFNIPKTSKTSIVKSTLDENISARKCHRLGGSWHQDPLGNWVCMIHGSIVEQIPQDPSFKYTAGTTEPENISMRKCKRIGGEVVLINGTSQWYCLIDINRVNTYYDATIGVKEPISSTLLDKEKIDFSKIKSQVSR